MNSRLRGCTKLIGSHHGPRCFLPFGQLAQAELCIPSGEARNLVASETVLAGAISDQCAVRSARTIRCRGGVGRPTGPGAQAVQPDAIRAIIRQAQNNPAQEAAAKSRHLNVWVSADELPMIRGRLPSWRRD
jgi:hypothetical protein